MADHRDTGLTLDPKFDANGLLTAIVTDGAVFGSAAKSMPAKLA
jgi:phosphoribosyl-AMP cyclohydrolase